MIDWVEDVRFVWSVTGSEDYCGASAEFDAGVTWMVSSSGGLYDDGPDDSVSSGRFVGDGASDCRYDYAIDVGAVVFGVIEYVDV